MDEAERARLRADDDERQRLVAGHEDVVAAIEELLFRHDPIGIAFDENTDEYRPEAETITIRRPEATSLADVRRIVHEEHVAWFDSDLAGPEDRYDAIAAEIWHLWS